MFKAFFVQTLCCKYASKKRYLVKYRSILRIIEIILDYDKNQLLRFKSMSIIIVKKKFFRLNLDIDNHSKYLIIRTVLMAV
jgi:hypothetical protein